MEEERVKFLDVLKIRNFGLLWTGQVISNFGDRFNYMAIMGLILFKWEGSAIDAGVMFIFMALPSLIFGPIAGVFVDRLNRKSVMIWADIIRAFLVALLPFVSSLAQIYVIIFLVASVSRFFYPARSAIIPSLVEKEKLLVANSLSQSTYQVSAIAGYALGGMFVGFLGPELVFYIDSVSYLVSALLIYMISYMHPLSESVKGFDGDIIKHVKDEFIEGLKFSFHEKRIFFIIVIFSLVMLFFGGINIIWVLLVRDVLRLGIEGMGFIESVMGVGLIIGTFLVGYIGYRFKNKHMVLVGVGVIAASFIAISVWPVLWNSVFWVFVVGIFNPFINIPIVTVIQKIVPSNMLGRVFSVFGALIEACGLVSMGIIGYLADVIDIQTLLLAMGIGTVAITIAGALTKIELEEDQILTET
ncbi:MAG: MFS transporter [Candidatus Methanofastidiosia archaeon]